jgi:hypothetical protein
MEITAGKTGIQTRCAGIRTECAGSPADKAGISVKGFLMFYERIIDVQGNGFYGNG